MQQACNTSQQVWFVHANDAQLDGIHFANYTKHTKTAPLQIKAINWRLTFFVIQTLLDVRRLILKTDMC
jgi:hypothetical protein